MSNTYRDNYNAKTKMYGRNGYDLKLRFPQRRNDGKGAGLVFEGEEYSFDTRQEALDFLDGKIGAVKS